jgi:hypothetical protein
VQSGSKKWGGVTPPILLCFSRRCEADKINSIHSGRKAVEKTFMAVLLVSVSQLVNASGQDCRDAKHAYKEARDEIPDYLKRYASCVASASSSNVEDCESQFEQLKQAQEEFEDAASTIQSECD